MIEWFRLHPEDLILVNKMIQGKKLMLDSMKELEKYQGTDEPEEKG
jgi:hypothetical protein